MSKFIMIVLVSLFALVTLACDTYYVGSPRQEGPRGEPGQSGQNGVDGEDGNVGPMGSQGESCTIVDNGDGTANLVCPDGTTWPLDDNREDQELQLDSECDDEIDYVVRAVYPRSPDSSGIVIRLSDTENIENAELLEFKVYACRDINLDGLFLDFHTYGVFPDEENQDATDPQGFLLPDWSERFHNFTLLEDGEFVEQVGIATEMSVSDMGGSAHFRSLSRMIKAGETVTYTFSASVRPEWPTSATFVVDVSGLIFNTPPEPNPLDRLIPWGLFITYPQLISIVP